MVVKTPPLGFDDFKVGDRIITHSITVTETHIVQFAGLSGDFNPIHMDEEFAKGTIFGGRVAHGELTLAMATGSFFQLISGTTIALLEVSAKFIKPVKVGDTIHTETEVVDKKVSNKYNGGIVIFRHEVKNQDNEEVAIIETKLLLSNGPASSAAGGATASSQ